MRRGGWIRDCELGGRLIARRWQVSRHKDEQG